MDRAGKPEILKNTLDALKTAQKVIDSLESNGMTAYRLVVLITTLDDVSINASKMTTVLIAGQPSLETQAVLLSIMSNGDGVTDISELLIHATLRLIGFEENLLEKLATKSGKIRDDDHFLRFD